MKTKNSKTFLIFTSSILLLMISGISDSAQAAITTLNCRRPTEAYSGKALGADITLEFAIASSGKVVLESKDATFYDRQGKANAEIHQIESITPRILNGKLVSFENFPREIDSIVLDQETQLGQIVRLNQAYLIDCHRPGPN